MTDTRGGYTITDVMSGSHTVNATKNGYKDGSESVNVVTGRDSDVTITLQEDIVPPDMEVTWHFPSP